MADADEVRRAEFREIARRFVLDEKNRRKLRINSDPTGQIARLLEKSYQRGRREEREGAPEITLPTEYMEWRIIPPKPRQAFWSICLSILGQDPAITSTEHWNLRFFEIDGKLRWVLMKDGQIDDVRVRNEWGERTIRPLVSRGLMTEVKGALIELTEFGRATWWAAVASCEESPIELVGTVPRSQWRL